MATRMPAVFFGHGNPLNAIEHNGYTDAWSTLGNSIPRPRAILMISAHWYEPGTAVTWNEHPRTIHDFGGFPPALYDVSYPALGSRDLAGRVVDLLKPARVERSERWGLDHGTWSVLTHVYPQADIPIVQLRIDETREPAFHFELGKRLTPLRDDGILVAGSGNLVHNLHAYAWGRHPAEPFDWALRFEAHARELMLTRRFEPLVDYEMLGRDALLAAPTPDHYLPLLYVVGAARDDDRVTFPVEGMDGGSISMLTVQFG
ncbi:MAG TPA: 4,5-DOPA dioxygenase extradiol [Candidatus Baltobacteraceae bacterium]|jgi:4,5-DOPA dioxygenase extradiol|nr:4,5-DOPA dioxygenase extradiol [Candidatus Baltobacteraceae bacterium]